MLKCPNCNCGHHSVTNTYSGEEVIYKRKNRIIHIIKRRRVCRHCKTAWITIERDEKGLIKEDKETEQPIVDSSGRPSDVISTPSPVQSLPPENFDNPNPFI